MMGRNAGRLHPRSLTVGPLKSYHSKTNQVFQPSFFKGTLLNFRNVPTCTSRGSFKVTARRDWMMAIWGQPSVMFTYLKPGWISSWMKFQWSHTESLVTWLKIIPKQTRISWDAMDFMGCDGFQVFARGWNSAENLRQKFAPEKMMVAWMSRWKLGYVRLGSMDYNPNMSHLSPSYIPSITRLHHVITQLLAMY